MGVLWLLMQVKSCLNTLSIMTEIKLELNTLNLSHCSINLCYITTALVGWNIW